MHYFKAVIALTVALTIPAVAWCVPLAVVSQDDVVALLRANDLGRLNKYLDATQHRFETGVITEIDLRNAYRPVYDLDMVAGKNLRTWAESAPSSYGAHLAFGIYLKKLGQSARGDKYVAETSIWKLVEGDRRFTYAARELRKSIPLTAKPCLSFFHLMEIDMYAGDRRAAAELIEKATRICPDNALIRDRYLLSQMPRWGGSYPAAEEFIVTTQNQGVPASVISQLEAIKYNDVGHTLEDSGSHEAAREQFRKALAFGMQAGGTFSIDWLQSARYYMCPVGNVYPYCH